MYYPDMTAASSLRSGIPMESSLSSLQTSQSSYSLHPSRPEISFNEHPFPLCKSSFLTSSPHPSMNVQTRSDTPFSLPYQRHLASDKMRIPNCQTHGTCATQPTSNSSYSSEYPTRSIGPSAITEHSCLTSPPRHRSKSVIGSTQKGRY